MHIEVAKVTGDSARCERWSLRGARWVEHERELTGDAVRCF